MKVSIKFSFLEGIYNVFFCSAMHNETTKIQGHFLDAKYPYITGYYLKPPLGLCTCLPYLCHYLWRLYIYPSHTGSMVRASLGLFDLDLKKTKQLTIVMSFQVTITK